MKSHETSGLHLGLALALAGASLVGAAPLDNSFSYRGRLTDKLTGTSVPNGYYDFIFSLYSQENPPQPAPAPNSKAISEVPVTNGFFTVSLDFGGANFRGDQRWLEIQARTNNAPAYDTLKPLQSLKPTPYALYSPVAGTATVANGVAAGTTMAVNSSRFSGLGIDDLYYAEWCLGCPLENLTDSYFLRIRSAFRSLVPAGIAYVTRFIVRGDGDVGIGTDNPQSRLHSVAEPGAGNAVQGTCFDTTASGVYGEHTAHGFGVAGRSSGSGIGVYGDNADPTGWAGYFNGRVFVNTALDVGGDIGCNGSLGFGAQIRQMINLWHQIYGIGIQHFTMYFRCDGSSPDGGFAWYAGGSHSDNRLDPGPGGTRLMSLDGSGFFVKENASVRSLTIRGGADLAEPFQMSDDKIPKGALVAIDEKNEGKLKLAGQAYDTHVAGIVSGANGLNPGISLHQEGMIEGGQNVALSGRVYALADASNGPIKPGDLLTSSSTPGHVMKVTDYAKAQGAIVGKSMSSLKEGRGLVLVLVSLQ